jgi:hypothetical protein
MCRLSVERGIDPYRLPENAREHAASDSSLEARGVAACVRAAPRHRPAVHEAALASGETQQLALRRAPAAAGARPQRLRRYEPSSVSSTGIPAATSSGPATSATASASTGSSSASACSASGGGPAT